MQVVTETAASSRVAWPTSQRVLLVDLDNVIGPAPGVARQLEWLLEHAGSTAHTLIAGHTATVAQCGTALHDCPVPARAVSGPNGADNLLIDDALALTLSFPGSTTFLVASSDRAFAALAPYAT